MITCLQETWKLQSKVTYSSTVYCNCSIYFLVYFLSSSMVEDLICLVHDCASRIKNSAWQEVQAKKYLMNG